MSEQGIQIDSIHVTPDQLQDYDWAKDRLTVNVIPMDRNEEMLKGVPHEQMADMAIVYRIDVDPTNETRGTVLIDNTVMEQLGVTPDQLHHDALENAEKVRPPQISTMGEMLGSMMGGIMDFTPDDPINQILVATTRDSFHGAGVIAYPDFMDKAAEKVGGDFYLLPSSIHEVILVPDRDDLNARQLGEMVRSVNAAEVRPEEQLSDGAYHYDSQEHIFEKAESFEERQAAKSAAEHETSDGRESVIAGLKERKTEGSREQHTTPEHHPHNRGGEAI